MTEEGCEKGEEEPGDLEPERAGDMRERAEEGFAEAAGAFTDAAGGLGVIFWRARGAVVAAGTGRGSVVAGRWRPGGWMRRGLAARSFAMREATRTPMPSLRPKRFGSMGEVY